MRGVQKVAYPAAGRRWTRSQHYNIPIMTETSSKLAGKPYYVNHHTQTTQWERPVGVAPQNAAPPAYAAPPPVNPAAPAPLPVGRSPRQLLPDQIVNTKISTLNFPPSTLNPQSSTLTPHPSALSPQPSSLIPHPSSLIPHPSSLNSHPSPLTPQPSALSPQPSTRKHSRALFPAQGGRRRGRRKGAPTT